MSKAEINRLLEQMATEPPVEFYYGTEPIGKQISIQRDDFQGTDCFRIPLWIENRGDKTVRPVGIELLSKKPFYGYSESLKVGRSDSVHRFGEWMYRTWKIVEAPGVLAPKVRGTVFFSICKEKRERVGDTQNFRNEKIKLADYEEIPIIITLYSDNYLPSRRKFSVIIERKNKPPQWQ